MNIANLIDSLKKDWATIKSDIEDLTPIYEAIKTENSGVTDPAEYATNVAKAIVANEKKLPIQWQATKLEKGVIKILTGLETGVAEGTIETIVKGLIK